MVYFISVIHALTCIFIVLFILLQDPKGGVLGSLGGGSSKSFFGAEGASPFLVSVTKWLTICFACSSFYLSYMSSKKDGSIMSDVQIEQTETKNQSQPDKTTETTGKNISNKSATAQESKQTSPDKNQSQPEKKNQDKGEKNKK